ncbi:hypothetical protein EDB85DRAFT_2179862 [Lactarius pseudohatsudake]|nr:hypothetical protein EDB85DRAFT_2179862 [Lactarius pseudohatsudake]
MQVFIHGSSLKSYLIGVVVPDPVQFAMFASRVLERRIDPEDVKVLKELCTDSRIVDVMLAELNKVAAKSLKGWIRAGKWNRRERPTIRKEAHGPGEDGELETEERAHLLFSLRLRSSGCTTYKDRAYAARNAEHAEPCITYHPRETEGEAVGAVHNELEADEDAREHAHDEHGCGPHGPCDGAEGDDEGEDGDEEGDEGQTRGEREEEVRAVEVHRWEEAHLEVVHVGVRVHEYEPDIDKKPECGGHAGDDQKGSGAGSRV